MTPRPLHVLGPLFLSDHTVADELLEALLEAPDAERIINQAWLDVHWEHSNVRDVLTAICDLWDRVPEPTVDFLQVCWCHNDDRWHNFLSHDMLECHHTACELYRRFDREGPTERVIDSLMFFRALDESDRYAQPIMAKMINRHAQGDAFLEDAFHLWYRYGPLRGLTSDAFDMLEDGLRCKATAYRAMRVVEIIEMKHVKQLLPTLAKLAAGSSTQPGVVRARHLIIDLSVTRHRKLVARAIRKAPWHNYLAHVPREALWYLVDYMRENRAMGVLSDMLSAVPDICVTRGVFTAFMACQPTRRERMTIYGMPKYAPLPTCTHQAVYYMYMRGEAPPTLFHDALRGHPEAVHAIARDAPLVRKEVTWARRKLLVCCLARGAADKGPKRAKAEDDGRLETLLQQQGDDVRRAVIQYL